MDILYGKKCIKTEAFTFEINQGGDLNLQVSGGSGRHVTITFVNEKFKSAEHNIEEATYTRSIWHVYGAIAEKITEIEERYNAPREVKEGA